MGAQDYISAVWRHENYYTSQGVMLHVPWQETESFLS